MVRLSSGSSTVFVRGFDFGTSDEQLEAHMGQAGTIQTVKWCTKGSARVTFSSKEEAQLAVDTLNSTTIPGNSRFIDVIMKDEGDEEPPAKKFKGGGKGKGNDNDWGAMVAAVTQQVMKGMGLAPQGKGAGGIKPGKPAAKASAQNGGGKGGRKGNSEDPAGSGRVFARGFDFGTTDEQFEGHMGTAGPIHAVYWVTKGSAVVVYKKKASAIKAANTLNGTTIGGNSRYIDVLLKEQE